MWLNYKTPYIATYAWQFTYANGAKCGDDGHIIFNVEWLCNEDVNEAKVMEAMQISECVYEMIIESVLACG